MSLTRTSGRKTWMALIASATDRASRSSAPDPRTISASRSREVPLHPRPRILTPTGRRLFPPFGRSAAQRPSIQCTGAQGDLEENPNCDPCPARRSPRRSGRRGVPRDAGRSPGRFRAPLGPGRQLSAWRSGRSLGQELVCHAFPVSFRGSRAGPRGAPAHVTRPRAGVGGGIGDRVPDDLLESFWISDHESPSREGAFRTPVECPCPLRRAAWIHGRLDDGGQGGSIELEPKLAVMMRDTSACRRQLRRRGRCAR